jgi:hypothetical protein
MASFRTSVRIVRVVLSAPEQPHEHSSYYQKEASWILFSLTMPQTRRNASADAKSDVPSANNERRSPNARSKTQDVNYPSQTAGRKRKPISGDDDNVSPKHQRVSAGQDTASSAKEAKKKRSDKNDGNAQQSKPRLTTSNLEFDYDRSQLRDSRPTPGRKARPRWAPIGAPQEIKDWVNESFYIAKPRKPTGRLNAAQKDRLYIDESRLDPFSTFHHLYRCHDKGRDGSPTHDEGGFELDWEKVDEWTKPHVYNKQKMMRSMDEAVSSMKSEQQQIYTLCSSSRVMV